VRISHATPRKPKILAPPRHRVPAPPHPTPRVSRPGTAQRKPYSP
jgi:hypothetical protein